MRLRASWAIVLVLIAALEFVQSYSGALPVVLFAAAAILPFLLVRLGVAVKIGAVPSAVLVVVLTLAVGWWALTGGASAGMRAFTDALPRLLTTSRPAAATAVLLAPSLLLVALVAAVVALCVFAPVPAASTRVGGVLAPTLGAVVLYVAAQLLSGGRADQHGFVAVSLLLVTVVSWSTPSWPGSERAGIAWSPSVLAPAVAVVSIGLAAAAIVPTSAAFEPRDHVTPPTVQLTEASPLSLLASWARNPGVDILHATVTGSQRLRLATLSQYTGSAWQVDDSYQEFGGVGSADLPGGTRRQPVSANVAITRLGGLWLPSPGGTTATTAAGAVVDPDNGGLARPVPVAAGLSYSVQGVVDAPARAALQAAGVVHGVPHRYLATPHLPAGFAQYARDVIRGASTPLEEAVAIESAVSTGRKLSTEAPTGTSYARLATFLFDTSSRSGAKTGTSEQFAASFAVLARAVGLPTRVVVGFVVGAPGAGGASVVHGKDAEAWPEVYFAGAGWVPFEPTPGSAATSGDDGLRQAVLDHVKGNAAVVAAPSRTPQPAASGAPSGGARRHATAHAHGSSVWLLTAGGAALVGLLIVLALLRAARSAAHRRRGAAGAWAEVLDLLVLLGRPAPRHVAAPELALSLDARLGRPGGAELVALAADRAAFAPGAPADAPQVWRQVRVLRRRARTTLPWHRRASFAVDPRPLLRRR